MYILNVIKRMILEREFLELAKTVYLKLFKFKWGKDNRKFIKLYASGEWDSAIDLGERIVKNGSKDKDLFQYLGICYIKVHKSFEAEYYMKRSLELRTKKNTEDIVRTIENTIFQDEENVKSKYEYLGGRYNLGVIEHIHTMEMEDKIYLTKIIPNKFPLQSKIHRERFFNQVICKKNSQFQGITPKMISYFQMKREKISVMSFDKINNDKTKGIDIQEIINMSENIIQGIKYEDAIGLLKIVDRGKSVPLSSLMHKLSTHEFIFSFMENNIKSLEGKFNLNKLIDRIKYIIIDLKMYEKINPKEDYVFCHRDLHKNNILYDKEKNQWFIIDWVNYGLGLKGNDVGRFLMSYGFTFKEIEEQYLNHVSNKMNQTMIEKIFFTYDLIILWVGVLNKDNMEEQVNDCISPAVQYMERLTGKKGDANEET